MAEVRTRGGGSGNRGAGASAPSANGSQKRAQRAVEPVEVDEWDDSPLVPRWKRISCLVLSILGFCDALYLTIDHFTGTLPVCSESGAINCQKVTTSAQSELFGIPVALLGLIFYTLMVVINLPPFWRRSVRWAPWARLIMVVGGMGFALYLVYSEIFTIKAICLYCTGVHLITLLLFILVVSSVQAMFGDETVAAG